MTATPWAGPVPLQQCIFDIKAALGGDVSLLHDLGAIHQSPAAATAQSVVGHACFSVEDTSLPQQIE